MKKIRSQELYRYLLQKGVLGCSDEEILAAKKQYRKQYKSQWKRQRLKQKPELRPNFTKKEIETINKAALSKGLTNTNFVRQAALSVANKKEIIANKDSLLTILQKVSMAGVILANKKSDLHFDPELKEADILLQESEQLLMKYLGYDFQDTLSL